MELICMEKMLPDYKARMRGEPTLPLAQRLYSNMIINKETGCWEWTGAKRDGYGKIIMGSRKDGSRHTASAHRISYEYCYGEIPDGMIICHKCDNPACINPEHLFVGTPLDNARDRDRKGRNVNLCGEENRSAKLTKKIVQEAREERSAKGTSYEKLAKKYGVAKKTIMNAIKGITWKCVEVPNI